MNKLFYVAVLIGFLSSCKKDDVSSNVNSESQLKSLIVNSLKPDVYLEVAYNYDNQDNKTFNFVNAAYFPNAKVDANVNFNGRQVEIGKGEKAFFDDLIAGDKPSSVYTNWIGNIGTFSVSNSSQISNFETKIYIPNQISLNVAKQDQTLNLTWNSDSKIDNNVFGVFLFYESPEGKFHNIYKVFKFDDNSGNGSINLAELNIPAGSRIDLTYGRGVYNDQKIDGKLVRTFAYTYSSRGVEI